MIVVTVGELEQYLNEYLKVSEFEDYTFNGINIGKRDWEVSGVITATDYERSLVDVAREENANVVIVHHGLWWGKPYTLTDEVYDDMAYLMKHDVALLSYHLPLDAHPEVGNNAYILGALGIEPPRWQPMDVGFYVDVDMTVADIVAKLERVFGMPKDVWEFGDGNVKRLGVISGAGGSFLGALLDLGVDTYITGEITYPQWRDFRRYGVNVILYGHYRSETGGPILLAKHIEKQFGLSSQFVDIYERAM